MPQSVDSSANSHGSGDRTRPAGALVLNTESLLRATLWLMLALSCLSFIEPSPYEFFFFALIPVALLNGLVFTRTTLTLFFLLFTTICAQLVSLAPYLDKPAVGVQTMSSSLYTAYSVYLHASGVLFAMIFSQRTSDRLGLALRAYALSCVFAGAWGLLSWLNVAGIGDREPIIGRIAGPFKDPNVLGTYCIMGVLYLMHGAIVGQRHRVLCFVGMSIALMGGVFLSFSRGSWAAMLFGATLLVALMYATARDARVRVRIRRGLVALGLLAALGGAIAVSNGTLRDTIADRAQVTHSYDEGETGRFGNQLRSIPMLIERPLGFGPFRFPLQFGLQPHNSYIGAFTDGGWVGGCAFLLLVLATARFALRQAVRRSPYRAHAQIVACALLALFLQAFQIDIDHWRFLFLMIGAVWGIESALRRDARRAPLEAGGPSPKPAG